MNHCFSYPSRRLSALRRQFGSRAFDEFALVQPPASYKQFFDFFAPDLPPRVVWTSNGVGVVDLARLPHPQALLTIHDPWYRRLPLYDVEWQKKDETDFE